MKRFFMTVREAVELVLEATVLGTRDMREPGKIYVLDMGEPVRIVDLARDMIRGGRLRFSYQTKYALSFEKAWMP